jgi:transcriptional regulator with XRE-family HTH domain
MNAFHITDPEGLPERLRQARERAGFSQRKLAFPGCTSNYISRIEAGDRLPSQQILEALARRTGVSAHWLATGEEDLLFTTIRSLVEDLRSGVEPSAQLLEILDQLTLPSWWQDYLDWMALDPSKRETAARPRGLPVSVPDWAVRYRRLRFSRSGRKWSQIGAKSGDSGRTNSHG